MSAAGNGRPAGARAAELLERLSSLVRAAEFDEGLDPAQWEALRYLCRCNRFSNAPGALTAYLGRTKGTVSQTVKALERKGLISRAPRPGEGRSVELHVTKEGRALLSRDPWTRLAAEVDAWPGDAQAALCDGVAELLIARLTANDLKPFGVCSSCRHFRRDANTGAEDAPHRCALLDVTLSADDAQKICAEFAAPDALP